jgi:hypothetical protein
LPSDYFRPGALYNAKENALGELMLGPGLVAGSELLVAAIPLSDSVALAQVLGHV